MVGDDMTVLGNDDKPVSAGSGVIGRLAKRGHVPLGYYKAPEKSAETFVELDGSRWAIPGDMASMEEDGTILLHGRGSTSINTGGEKVFPEEVEAALKAHRDIDDTLVVGVPDERWGQIVVALYQSCGNKELALDEVRDFCRCTIASYKVPLYCEPAHAHAVVRLLALGPLVLEVDFRIFFLIRGEAFL